MQLFHFCKSFGAIAYHEGCFKWSYIPVTVRIGSVSDRKRIGSFFSGSGIGSEIISKDWDRIENFVGKSFPIPIQSVLYRNDGRMLRERPDQKFIHMFYIL